MWLISKGGAINSEKVDVIRVDKKNRVTEHGFMVCVSAMNGHLIMVYETERAEVANRVMRNVIIAVNEDRYNFYLFDKDGQAPDRIMGEKAIYWIDNDGNLREWADGQIS